ncbi:MAG TPA: hypothetical protein VD968_05200 [Pyrinomonadaceae bacterium]|nr:hypothetical protein [Pyrinomonadaceae bacterium]
MSDESRQGVGDEGIGEGNLQGERGAPPYADRAYAGEQEPTGGQGPTQAGTAGGTNVSAQGGGTGSSKQGGNTSGAGAEGSSSK